MSPWHISGQGSLPCVPIGSEASIHQPGCGPHSASFHGGPLPSACSSRSSPAHSYSYKQECLAGQCVAALSLAQLVRGLCSPKDSFTPKTLLACQAMLQSKWAICFISIYLYLHGHVIFFLSPTTTCYFNFAASFVILVSADLTTTCYFNFVSAFVILISAKSLSLSHIMVT